MTPRPALGHRTAVVLLHGLCSTPDELMLLHNPLRQRGYTVVPQEIEGYSFDARHPKRAATPWRTWVQAVQRQVSTLRETHHKVVVVGISAGTSLALAASMGGPSVADGLILMSTTLRYDGWAIPPWHFLLPLALYTPLGHLWQYREKAPYGVKNERIRAWIARELESRRISCAGSATLSVSHLRENDRLLRHVRPSLSLVSCSQVLALHADEDEVASPRNLSLLTEGLTSVSRLQLVTVHDSYHMISIDNDRQQVLQESLQFIRNLSDTA